MPCLTYSGCLWGGGVGEESPLCSVLLSLFQEALLGIKSQFSTCLQLHNPLPALLFLPQLCAGLGTSLPSSHCLTSLSDPPKARCCQRCGTGDNHHGKGGLLHATQAGHPHQQRGQKLEMEKGYFDAVKADLPLHFNKPVIVTCLFAVNVPMQY